MRVVEFVGPPGAGKSRIIARAVRASSDEIVEPQTATMRWARTANPSRALRAGLRVLPTDLARKITNRLLARGLFTRAALERFRRRYPEYIDATLDLVQRRRDVLPEAELFRGWITGLAARYQLASEALDPTAALVLEEGFGTRAVGLFSFGWDPTDAPDVTRCVSVMPIPDVVVLVDTVVEVCRQRLEVRGWTRRTRGFSDTAKTTYLANARDLARLVADELGARGAQIAVVKSETADDVDPAVREVLGALERAKTNRPTG